MHWEKSKIANTLINKEINIFHKNLIIQRTSIEKLPTKPKAQNPRNYDAIVFCNWLISNLTARLPNNVPISVTGRSYSENEKVALLCLLFCDSKVFKKQ